MKKIIICFSILFVFILTLCLCYEYQPHYDNSKQLEYGEDTNINTVDDNLFVSDEIVTEDIEDILKDYKDEEISEFFENVKKDNYDFSDIEGNYRQQIIEFYQNGYYYKTWQILNEHVQFTNIKPEKDGKDRTYYKLELTYLIPKDLSYCQAICSQYNGTLASIKDYLCTMYATSNIQIFKETDYVSIDHNMYEFLIMDFNVEKLYSDVVVLEDYEITLDQDPY